MFTRTHLVVAAWLLLGWPGWLPAAPAAAADRPHVFLITIDGLAAYYLADEKSPLPTLRRLAREGAVAEGMRVSNPAITWPNHTTLVTGVRPGKHSVLFNGVLVRPGPGRPVRVDGQRDQAELVAVPTLFDHLHRAGDRTAEINWPCTRRSRSLDDSFPDVPDSVSHMTPRLRDELIAARLLEGTNDAAFRALSAAAKDQVWTAAAAHVIRQRRPNFMAIHLLVTDSIQHKYGPQSPAAYAALAQVDGQVAELLRAIEAAGLRDRATVVVTADHGFEKALKLIQANVTFRKAGLLAVGNAPGMLSARAQMISEGGTALVYFTDPATAAADRAKVMELMRTHEGIAEIIEPARFAALGLPDPASNPQMGELVLVAKEGYAFHNEARGEDSIVEVTLADGNQGHHGYLSTVPKMNASFLAWGRGIRPGAKLGVIDNLDVAPTLARLLGRELPGADGKVLERLLAVEGSGR